MFNKTQHPISFGFRKGYDKAPPNDIRDYALTNGFFKNEKDLRRLSEGQIAMQIMQDMNEGNKDLQFFKIFPLYNIGSKSKELSRDRLFWLMLTGITVQNKMITASRLKQVSIIAVCVSRLPSIQWVSPQLVDELVSMLNQENLEMERINIIDIN